jgi:UDP-glucuronate decarboxylase
MEKLFNIIAEDAEKITKKLVLSGLQEKTILITGASGLVGTYILACLKNLSNKNNGKIKTIAVVQSDIPSYLKNFLDNEGAEIFKGDLTDYGFCQSLPQADYIIHAAGYGQPGMFMADQVKTITLNTFSTLQLFKKLRPEGKFLFISTSEVYSGLPNPPYKEEQIGTTNTTHPRSCYIEAKRCGEAICNAYRAKGVDAKSARLCLAYGPGTKQGDKRVLNSFIEKATKGKIEMMDRGEAKRTYCYIADAVEIMLAILLHGKEPIYNVGGISKTTIAELAQRIGKYMDVPVIFPENSSGTMAGAPDDVFLDMDKVKNEFNKIEYISFDEGLKKTIDWQKELYKN